MYHSSYISPPLTMSRYPEHDILSQIKEAYQDLHIHNIYRAVSQDRAQLMASDSGEPANLQQLMTLQTYPGHTSSILSLASASCPHAAWWCLPADMEPAATQIGHAIMQAQDRKQRFNADAQRAEQAVSEASVAAQQLGLMQPGL